MRNEKSDNRDQAKRQSGKSDSETRLRMILGNRGLGLKWLSDETGIAQSTLSDYQTGTQPRVEAAIKIAKALSVPVEWLFSEGGDASLPDPVAPRSFRIPALQDAASAGGGQLIAENELSSGPFRFSEDWLRSRFGKLTSLRVVEVRGESQEPDLRDGDWVLIDEGKNSVEDGLAVIRLDDSLLIKRLQREGHMLHLLSKNPDYLTTTLDLRKDEDRLKVIGKVVYSFKSVR
jgi:transcriptional regulator with XRE-family HTH domain